MIIDGNEYLSFIYGHELEKSPKVKDFGIDETDLQECKSYDDAMKKYHSELDGCCENRGYYLAVPLWIAEFTFWFFNNYGMLSRVSFDDILSIVVLVFVWGLEFVVSIFLGGVLIIALQAWLLKWILPKSLVKYVVGLAIKMPRRSKKYDKVCCYLQAKSRYEKFAHKYDKIYPNIRNFEYDLKAYGQAKMLELVDKLKEYIKEQNEIIKKENIRQSQKFWFDLDPYEFENEVALWYERKGYNCKVTKKSGDGGVDIVLTKGGKKAYVQCKRYTTSKVDRPTLNQLYGVVCAEGADYGIVACLLGATDEAKEFAHKVGIKIVTIADLCPEEDLFHQKNLKKQCNSEVIKVNDFWCEIGDFQIQSNLYVTEKDLFLFTSKWENSDMYCPINYSGLTFCFYCTVEEANNFKEWLCKEKIPHTIPHIVPNRSRRSYRKKWYR